MPVLSVCPIVSVSPFLVQELVLLHVALPLPVTATAPCGIVPCIKEEQ